MENFEEALGNLYVSLYKMRQANMHQDEYDAMGSLINMLSKDREFMREKFDIEY